MRRRDIEDLLHRRPLKPFQLTVTSGHTFEVRHPEMAIVGKTVVAVGMPPADDDIPAIEDLIWLDYLHIVMCHPIREKDDAPF